MSLIELGELQADLDEPSFTRVRRSRWRGSVAGVIALICLLLLAGKAPQARMTLLAQLQTNGAALFLIIGEELAVSDEDGLSLFRGGQRLWHVNYAPDVRYNLESHDDLLVVAGAGGLYASTVAFDRHTGAKRFSLDAAARFYGPFVVASGVRSADFQPGPVHVYSAANGALLWTLQPEFARAYAVDATRRVLGRLGPSGDFAEHDLATGVVTRTAELGIKGGEVQLSYDIAPTLQVTWLNDDETVSRRYDTESLRETTIAPPPGYDCGQTWCRLSSEDGGMDLIDKQTGQRRHHLPRWQTAISAENGILGTVSEAGRRWWELLDPGTGRVVTAPSRWVPLADHSIGAAGDLRRDDTLLVVPEKSRLHLAELRPEGLCVLGTLPHLLVTGYQAKGRFLAYHFGQQIWWWRLV